MQKYNYWVFLRLLNIGEGKTLDQIFEGLVVKSTGSWCQVKTALGLIDCRVKGKFRIKGIRTTNPITVGDFVKYTLNTEDQTGTIFDIVPRQNYIIRKAIQLHRESQLIAANVDQAILMVSLKNPETLPEFIDRFLLSTEAYFIETIIVVNKTDLIDEATYTAFAAIYEPIGYRCIPISVVSQKNLDKVASVLQNKTTIISGNSGVGKSSLLQHFLPGEQIKVDSISDYHQTGKHTTTFSEMFFIDEETRIIDTPGIRSYGIIDIDKSEVGLYFKEIFHTSKECKFSNCRHLNEPQCAVIEAVKRGEISESRYRSYLNIVLDDESKYR